MANKDRNIHHADHYHHHHRVQVQAQSIFIRLMIMVLVTKYTIQKHGYVAILIFRKSWLTYSHRVLYTYYCLPVPMYRCH